MSQDKSPHEVGAQILEEASDWFIELNEGEAGASLREEFNQWLRRSPEHVRAYVEIAAAWEESSRLQGLHAVDPAALIAQTLAESNVVAHPAATTLLHVESHRSSVLRGPRRWMWRRAAPVAAAAVLCAALGIWVHGQTNTFGTAVGEQRTLMLPDGSSVQLNALSRIKIDYSSTERGIELLAGQALFQVAKDRHRPFIVHSDDVSVRAVGTQFDVYRREKGGVTVTVLEGSVSLLRTTLPVEQAEAVAVSAGEQVIVTAKAVAQPKRTNVADVTAWTSHKLVFDDTPLAEVVEEFNRYNTRRLVIDDSRLEVFHIRGTFPATQSGWLIELLRDRFDVQITETEREIRISQRINSGTR